MVHVLLRRRLLDEAEDERHHRFALSVVERELRHAQPFVVMLVLRRLVVVAARVPQLLPHEAVAAVGIERLDEETCVRIEVRRIETVTRVRRLMRFALALQIVRVFGMTIGSSPASPPIVSRP